MGRDKYESLRSFILETLTTEKEVTINDLLIEAEKKFSTKLGQNMGWYVYQVKLDLEARGLIKSQKSVQNKKPIIKKMNQSRLKDDIKKETTEAHLAKASRTVKSKFIELFLGKALIIHSPGRINLIGEHTDYNNGYVMPSAIDKGIQFAIAPSKEQNSMVYSVKYNQFHTIDHNNIHKVKSPEWANYILGVLRQISSNGRVVKPFNCVFDGDLPLGAGLSSSAAMECGFAFALNELNELNLSRLDMIHMAQWAEHNYVGVKCGIMDQFTSMMGQQGQVILLDCQSLSYSYFPLELLDYCLVLCDTKIKHSLASSEYNKRREECEHGVEILQRIYPHIKSLRDVTMDMLEQNQTLFSEEVLKRCTYVVLENDRVLKAGDDLKKGDLIAFGRKMFETHQGLSELYSVSCPELDFLVDNAKASAGVVGARMMGGGFGGCTINIVKQSRAGDFIFEMKKLYKQRFTSELATHIVKTGNGTSVIERPQ